MTAETGFVDWNDLDSQRHWYKIRHEFESELRAATSDIRKAFEVSLKLNTATIVTDGERSCLRIPISAVWRDQLEQTIAALLVTAPVEDEVRMAAIAHGVSELVQRWVERAVPVGASPEFLYPDREVRWPNEPESADATGQAVKEETAAT